MNKNMARALLHRHRGVGLRWWNPRKRSVTSRNRDVIHVDSRLWLYHCRLDGLHRQLRGFTSFLRLGVEKPLWKAPKIIHIGMGDNNRSSITRTYMYVVWLYGFYNSTECMSAPASSRHAAPGTRPWQWLCEPTTARPGWGRPAVL